MTAPADTRFSRTEARGEGPERAIKVHYFNNWTDSSEPTAPDDRKQHPLATGQAVKKCRNPVFPIIGCVPAVFLAQCSYPLQWIYPSPTTHLPRFLPVALTFTRFFELCFLPGFALLLVYPYIRHRCEPDVRLEQNIFWTQFVRIAFAPACTTFRFVWIIRDKKYRDGFEK